MSGELGYEIQCDASQLYKVYTELRIRGADLGLKPFGRLLRESFYL